MVARHLAVFAVLVAACSQASPAAAVTPSAVATPSEVAATPSPVADLPLTKLGFSCRLPVFTYEIGGFTRTVQGGFVHFPRAELVIDPNARFSQDSQGVLTGETGPVLHGQGDVFYDAGELRWVPVSAQQSRPDGFEYAYSTVEPGTNATIVHVVDVATGEDRTFRVNMSEGLTVADYRASGVYLLKAPGLGGPSEGVWLMNPNTGAVKQLRAVHNVWAVRNGIAWVARLDARDKTQWPPIELPPANSIIRVDLATGAEQTWFYRAGTYPWWLGFGPSGWPVIFTGLGEQGVREIRLLDHANENGQLVYSGKIDFVRVQGDGGRLWLGATQGVYLYRRGTGLQKVFAYQQPQPDGLARVILPTGFCL
jgi:hypothetical protein